MPHTVFNACPSGPQLGLKNTVFSLALTFTPVVLLPFFLFYVSLSTSQGSFFLFSHPLETARGSENKSERWRDGERLNSVGLMLSDGWRVGSNATACCLSSSCVFPHVLGGNGCSMVISVL